jgi:tetratricopeptide (TPR) repeat protein
MKFSLSMTKRGKKAQPVQLQDPAGDDGGEVDVTDKVPPPSEAPKPPRAPKLKKSSTSSGGGGGGGAVKDENGSSVGGPATEPTTDADGVGTPAKRRSSKKQKEKIGKSKSTSSLGSRDHGGKKKKSDISKSTSSLGSREGKGKKSKRKSNLSSNSSKGGDSDANPPLPPKSNGKNGTKKKKKQSAPPAAELEEEKKEMLVSEDENGGGDQQQEEPPYLEEGGNFGPDSYDGDSLGDDDERIKEEDILGEEVELDDDDDLSVDPDEEDDDLGDLQQSTHTARRTPSTHGTRQSLADESDDFATDLKNSQLIIDSPPYSDMRDSQLIFDGPPIGEIVATSTDGEDVSEIGEGVADGVIEAEVIDGIEIIYNPLDSDVCFDDRGHPGTTDLIKVLRDLLAELDGIDYSPPIYKAIKKRLKGRRFLIRTRRDERTSWKEASKPEVIQLLGDCFNEERRRKRDGVTDDESEIDSIMQDSAQELSEPSLSAGEMLDDDVILSPNDPPSRKATPRHSNIVPATRPTRVESFRNGSDGAISNGQNGSFEVKNRSAAPGDPHPSLQQAIAACEVAQDYARPYDNVDVMHKGIAAEEKLLMLLGLADARNTENLKEELTKLEDLTKRMKYASMAPVLEMVEKIELHLTDFFQICAANSKSSHLHDGRDGSENIQDRHGDSEEDTEQDLSGGIRHKRSINVQSDSERDRKETPDQNIEDENEDEGDDNASDEAMWNNGGHDDDHDLSPSRSDRDLDPDPRFSRSEASFSYNDGRALDDGFHDGNPHQADDPPESFEIAGECYSTEIKNGSYVEGESEENLSYGESTDGMDYDAEMEERLLGGENDVEDYEDDQEFDEDDDEAGERKEYYDEADEGNIEDGDDEEYEELQEDELNATAASVTDGHVLEIGDPKDNDELSSVGESVPGIYGSESEEEDGEMEEFEVLDEDDEDDDNDESRTSDSEDDLTNVTPEPTKPKSIFEKPNPKIEQFFDRLQHFFEVRRKTSERAEIMDPSKKFRNLKVKNHSGGILKKNGKYKKEYQQHDLNDKLVRNLDDLYDAAAPAQAELKFFLQQMVRDVRGLEEESLLLPPLKPRDRAFEKAKSEYGHRSPGPPESWLYDIVRAGVICRSYKQMADVNKWLSKNCHVVQTKNRFFEPAFNGYRDLLFHVSIPFRDDLAHICEIQVHHRDMYGLNEQFGLPKHYEFFRSCFAGHWRSQDDILDDLSMMSKFGNIGGPLMKKLLKSKDPEQLRLFAGLCRDKLDEFDRSLELYRRVLNLQEDSHGSEHEQMAATYLSIGLVLGAMGDTDASLLNLQKALAIQESFLGSNHVEVADSYAEIGRMLNKKGDFSGALQQYRRALAIRETKLGKEHFLVVKSLQDIGMALQEKGDFRQAEAEYRRALKIQQDVLGDVHPDVAVTHAMIGTTLCQHGEFVKAMEEHRLALSIRETGLGKNHPTTAESHTDIGILLCQKGEYEFSEWRHRKALRIREAMRGKDDEECAISHGHLGEVLSRRGDNEGAIAELKRAQEIREANVGMDSPITAGSYIDLGNIFCRMGRYKEALKEYRRAKVIRESILGPTHPDTAQAYMCVGIALNLDGDHEGALAEHRMALSVFEAYLGKSHPRTATGYQSFADALLANGDRDAALIEHRKALAVRANVLAKDHPDTAISCSRIGDLLSGKGDLVGALVAYRQALAITVGLCGEDHQESASAHINVGRVLAAQGDLEEAMQEMRQSLTVRETSLGKDHVETGRAYILMGSLYSMQGKFDEAHEMHSKGVSSLTKQLGKKHAETKRARKKLMSAENEEKEKEL